MENRIFNSVLKLTWQHAGCGSKAAKKCVLPSTIIYHFDVELPYKKVVGFAMEHYLSLLLSYDICAWVKKL